jgi:DNA-directed RNA polymerase subunit M/transcription elongation factor TFIIS
MTLIKCPNCGAEYLPEEIFYPNSVFNKNIEVVRDEKGKIVYKNGNSFCLTEEFECENCGCNFSIESKVSFITKALKKDNFDEETIINL